MFYVLDKIYLPLKQFKYKAILNVIGRGIQDSCVDNRAKWLYVKLNKNFQVKVMDVEQRLNYFVFRVINICVWKDNHIGPCRLSGFEHSITHGRFWVLFTCFSCSLFSLSCSLFLFLNVYLCLSISRIFYIFSCLPFSLFRFISVKL